MTDDVVKPYPTLSAIGMEVEVCLVDRETLDVRPVADEVLAELAGPGASDATDGDIGWSNELALHQLEVKTFAPTPTAADSARSMAASLRRMDERLARRGVAALPSGMHPWMDPATETVLWPHEGAEIYRAYDAIYDCKRHGWSNVQSAHLNVPYDGDLDFSAVMAAARIVLPLVPALAASSPYVEGRATGRLCNRLRHYANNALRTPAMTGDVIPEPVYEREEYERTIIGAIARELRDVVPGSVIAGENWSNARGAIARFDRNAIELRLADAQECVRADAAIAGLLAGIMRGLFEERWSSRAVQAVASSGMLRTVLFEAGVDGPCAKLPLALTRLFGRPVSTAKALLESLAPECAEDDAALSEALAVVLERGTLAERLLAAAGPEPDRERLRDTYRQLAGCLVEDAPFRP